MYEPFLKGMRKIILAKKSITTVHKIIWKVSDYKQYKYYL